MTHRTWLAKRRSNRSSLRLNFLSVSKKAVKTATGQKTVTPPVGIALQVIKSTPYLMLQSFIIIKYIDKWSSKKCIEWNGIKITELELMEVEIIYFRYLTETLVGNSIDQQNAQLK